MNSFLNPEVSINNYSKKSYSFYLDSVMGNPQPGTMISPSGNKFVVAWNEATRKAKLEQHRNLFIQDQFYNLIIVISVIVAVVFAAFQILSLSILFQMSSLITIYGFKLKTYKKLKEKENEFVEQRVLLAQQEFIDQRSKNKNYLNRLNLLASSILKKHLGVNDPEVTAYNLSIKH